VKRHDHRQSMWIVCGGHAFWCYQCGAWRPCRVETPNTWVPTGPWQRPSGIGGPNPASKS
jgi:hypothetical protein